MSNESQIPDSDPELPVGSTSIERRAGEILDEAGPTPGETELPLDERRGLADQFWLHALLAHVLNPTANIAHRESLIQHVMRSISVEGQVSMAPASDAAKSQASRRSRLAMAASLAALIIVGVILLSPQAGPKTAMAAVEQSLKAAAQDVDRRYHIQMTTANDVSLPPIMLTVRGSNQFVWEQPMPRGTLQAGSNGKEFWVVPAVGPVMIAAEGSRLERLLAERQDSTPILHLATALEWLRDRYDLELLPEEDISIESSSQPVRCTHYRGSLRNHGELLQPETMEIWSDRNTGVVQRMRLTWPALMKSGVHQAELQIQQPPRDLPADWYEHSSHHTSQRRVVRPKGKFTPPS